MDVASIILQPDSRFGALNPYILSDQARMESLVDGVDSSSVAVYKDDEGRYKHVCKWKDVRCNGRRRVTNIIIESALPGKVDFSFLPELTRIFSIRSFVYGDNAEIANCKVSGTLNTASLPSRITDFYSSDLNLRGSVDLRRLPQSMRCLEIENNNFSGSIYLHKLPKSFSRLVVPKNSFFGSIFLEFLPKKLSMLHMSANELSGTLQLMNLPECLWSLNLNDNFFSGSVCLNRLPRA